MFRRFNSYSKQHALYRALKAFRQIPKSLFILQVIDAPVLRHGSTVAWRHLNLLGEYDFSAEKLRDSVGIRLPKLGG